MVRLNLPEYQFKTKRTGAYLSIWDSCRAKFVRLTPEEWVRQNFVAHLINGLSLPSGLIANETAVSISGMTKRCDTVVYNRQLRPIVIVEYKAPTVRITQEVFDQIFAYNTTLSVPILIMTNGLHHVCIDLTKHPAQFFPFEQLAERMAQLL